MNSTLAPSKTIGTYHFLKLGWKAVRPPLLTAPPLTRGEGTHLLVEQANGPCGLCGPGSPLENLLFVPSLLSSFYVHLVPTGFLYQYFNRLLLTYA